MHGTVVPSCVVARCSSCSQSVEVGQRFCPACGEPQHGVELLDVAARPAAQRTSTTVSRNSSSNRWFVVLALVVAGAVGWSLVSSSGEVGTVEDAIEDEVGADEPDVEPTTTQPDEESDEEALDGELDASTSSSARAPFPGEGEDSDADGDGQGGDGRELLPLLPGSGLALAVGNPLRVTDLDTGVTVETTVRASPVGVIGEHLLLRDQNGTRFVTLRLDDLEGEPTWLGRGDAGYAYRVEPAEEDGQVWILTERWDTTEPAQIETLVDLETGEELRERAFEFDASFWSIGPNPTTNYRTPRSGGVYQRDGDGFLRIADGSLVAAGEELLLIEDCDDRLRCTLTWRRVDAPTEPVRRPIPSVGEGTIASGALIGSDRLLVFATLGDWRYSVLDLETGETVVTGLDFQGELPVSASEDGRYMAFNRNGDATVMDLDTGTDVILPGGFNSGSVLLINQP